MAPPPKTVRIEDVSELEDGIAILKVRAPWYRLILNGQKTWEIRSTKCEKAAGTAGAMPTALSHTWLSPRRPCRTHGSHPVGSHAFRVCAYAVSIQPSGVAADGMLHGMADFVACIGPLDQAQWELRGSY